MATTSTMLSDAAKARAAAEKAAAKAAKALEPRKIFTVTASTEGKPASVFTFKSERQATKTVETLGKLFATAEVVLTETVVTDKSDAAVAAFIATIVV